MPLITQMVGQLGLQPSLQHPLHQLRQKPAPSPVTWTPPSSTLAITSSKNPWSNSRSTASCAGSLTGSPGWNHYRLDSQSLWSRLISVVPDPVKKQVDTAQVGVDFFVCLLYGHIAVAMVAMGAIAVGGVNKWTLPVAVAVPLGFVPAWYRLAVATTDQWAVAIQALVDLGRQPLAAALGLLMPTTIEDERTMWERVSRFSSREYDFERGRLLSEFRAKPQGDDHHLQAPTDGDQRKATQPKLPST